MTWGILMKSSNGFFSTGFVSLCADNPIFYTLDDVMASGGGPLSAYTDSYKTVLSDYYKFKLSEKYLGVMPTGYQQQCFRPRLMGFTGITHCWI